MYYGTSTVRRTTSTGTRTVTLRPNICTVRILIPHLKSSIQCVYSSYVAIADCCFNSSSIETVCDRELPPPAQKGTRTYLSMGRVTLFVRDSCPYCREVEQIISGHFQALREEQLQLVAKQTEARAQSEAAAPSGSDATAQASAQASAGKDGTPNPLQLPFFDLKLSLLSCDDGARAAQCIRLTNRRTVPHIFFNKEYIGDATTFLQLQKDPDSLRQKLRNLGKVPTLSWPPAPEAAMIKGTTIHIF